METEILRLKSPPSVTCLVLLVSVFDVNVPLENLQTLQRNHKPENTDSYGILTNSDVKTTHIVKVCVKS